MINSDCVKVAIEELKKIKIKAQSRIVEDYSGISFWLNDAVDGRVSLFNEAISEADDSVDGKNVIDEQLSIMIDVIRGSNSPYASEYVDELIDIINK